MKTMINKTHVEGFVYEHDLKKKVTGPQSKAPGTEYIAGSISIATDDAGINIVPVYFSYVTPLTKNKKPNSAYSVLNSFIDGTYKTVMAHGQENATKVSIDSAIGVNDFYTDKSGKEELVSAKRNEGGFISVVNALNEDEKMRNTFKCDMVITNVTRVEGNEDKGTVDKVVVKGAAFGYNNTLLPVEFVATNAGAMDYFEGLGVSRSEPVFTNLWGRQISETIVRKITEESAFGEDSVREVRSSRKEFLITGAAKETYEWDDESTLTAKELNDMITARETHLATVKQQYLDYKKSQTAPAAIATSSAFDF